MLKPEQLKILDASYKKANLENICNEIQTLESQQQKELLILLKKVKHLFVVSLGDFITDPVHLKLKEDYKPYHGKAFPVPHVHKKILKK